MSLCITTNKKVGCKTFNLNPEWTCRNKPCFRWCYDSIISKNGVKYPSYSSIKRGRTRNHRALSNPIKAADELIEIIQEDNYFRWFSGGDLTKQAAPFVNKAAKKCPNTMMFLPTKNIKEGLKLYQKYDNLQVIFSMWPGWKENDTIKNYRHSILIGRHDAAPKDYFLCPGKCEGCRYCYYPGGNVAFRWHGTKSKYKEIKNAKTI